MYPTKSRVDNKGKNYEVALYFIYYKYIYEEKTNVRWIQV